MPHTTNEVHNGSTVFALMFCERPRRLDTQQQLVGPLLFCTEDDAIEYLYDEIIRHRMVDTVTATQLQEQFPGEPLFSSPGSVLSIHSGLLAMGLPAMKRRLCDFFVELFNDEVCEVWYSIDLVDAPAHRDAEGIALELALSRRRVQVLEGALREIDDRCSGSGSHQDVLQANIEEAAATAQGALNDTSHQEIAG